MNKLIIPMYSMRSHRTGKYQLMYDSNTNIILHKLAEYKAGDVIDVTIPRQCDITQLETLFELTNAYECDVNLLFVDYGTHAGDTRDCLDYRLGGILFGKYDEVECHVETVKPRGGPLVWDYMIFNSSVLYEERPYADKHFTSILRLLSAGYHVSFSTVAQKDLLPLFLEHNSSIDVNFFRHDIFDIQIEKFYDENLCKRLEYIVPKGAYFFPFRISDKAYNFEAVKKLGNVVVTDPNESFTERGTVTNLSGIHKCKKTIYINMLRLMKNRPDIKIPLYENIEFNYHISIVEMLAYCPDNILYLYSNINLSENLIKRYIKS